MEIKHDYSDFLEEKHLLEFSRQIAAGMVKIQNSSSLDLRLALILNTL